MLVFTITVEDQIYLFYGTFLSISRTPNYDKIIMR